LRLCLLHYEQAKKIDNLKIQMRLRICKILLWAALVGILVSGFGTLNTMVSLKYETDSPNECISKVTGDNLCHSIQTLQILIGICILTIILLLIFRKRLVNQQNTMK
jgi:RsiW-degrading membrane proteinase PrsW (M82 family)